MVAHLSGKSPSPKGHAGASGGHGGGSGGGGGCYGGRGGGGLMSEDPKIQYLKNLMLKVLEI
jgi:hypothetical protein